MLELAFYMLLRTKTFCKFTEIAVKSLAWYSRSKAEVLDHWVSIYRVTGWGYALDNIKGITQDVVKETAGYVKGLIDYTVP